MKNNRNKSYPNKQIEADVLEQGGNPTENQLTMLYINSLKSLLFTLNTRGVNSCNGKKPLTDEEFKIIRNAICTITDILDPIIRPNKSEVPLWYAIMDKLDKSCDKAGIEPKMSNIFIGEHIYETDAILTRDKDDKRSKRQSIRDSGFLSTYVSHIEKHLKDIELQAKEASNNTGAD